MCIYCAFSDEGLMYCQTKDDGTMAGIDAKAWENNPAKPILIAGPTASGKSALGLKIAAQSGRAIINADALQVYSGWRIVTARPSEEETKKAPHHLYGHVPLNEEYSVGQWLRDLEPFLSNQNPAPIILGGTGLYFRALTEGIADIPQTQVTLRIHSSNLIKNNNWKIMLDKIHPITLSRIDINNPMRVARAWEVEQQTGTPLHVWQDDTPAPLVSIDDCLPFVLNADRDWLNDRIERRFDHMLELGALEEAAAILPHWDPDAQSSRAIGAAELIAHLRGELTLEEARTGAIIASRQYAKRQRTWFRARMQGWTAIELPN